MQHGQKVKQYILANFLFTHDSSALGDHDDLIESGILDSTGVFEVLVYIQDEFKFTLDPDEYRPDNVSTIARIDALVTRKLAR